MSAHLADLRLVQGIRVELNIRVFGLGLDMSITFWVLGPDDIAVLDHVAADVFDNPIDPRWAAEFFADPRHHIAVALDADCVVGFASGFHYVHPDKPPTLWVNEVGVAPTHQNRGIGRQVLTTLLEHGRAIGCAEAWLGTETSNLAARRSYAGAGGIEEEEEFIQVTFRLTPLES